MVFHIYIKYSLISIFIKQISIKIITYRYTLENMNKYVIVKDKFRTSNLVEVPEFNSTLVSLTKYNSSYSVGNWFKDRFIKEKDLEKWEMKNNIRKYNI